VRGVGLRGYVLAGVREGIMVWWWRCGGFALVWPVSSLDSCPALGTQLDMSAKPLLSGKALSAYTALVFSRSYPGHFRRV